MSPLGGHLLTLLLMSQATSTVGEAKILANESWNAENRFVQAVVLDRLIREGRTAAPDLLARLFPKFRDQTTILLVRHPSKPHDVWMDLLARTNVADSHWLAFANALVRARAPRFAEYLLEKLPDRIEVRAIDPDGIGGGSFGMVTGCPIRSPGPRLACYQLDERPIAAASDWRPFSEGPHPLFFRREEIEGLAPNCGHCSSDPSGDSAKRYLRDYLAQLCALPETTLDPLLSNDLPAPSYESVASLEARARVRHTNAFQLAVRRLKEAGLVADVPTLLPAITVVDQRTGAH